MELQADKDYVLLPYGYIVVPADKLAEAMKLITFVDTNYENGEWVYEVQTDRLYKNEVKLIQGSKLIASVMAQRMEGK